MNLLDLLYNPPGVIWPLVLFVCLLIVLRQMKADIEPIFKAVIAGLAKQAASNSQFFAICMAIGISASLSAMNEAFRELTAERAAAMSYFQLAALFSQIANPFLVAVIAYVVPKNTPRSTGTTAPPFPSSAGGS